MSRTTQVSGTSFGICRPAPAWANAGQGEAYPLYGAVEMDHYGIAEAVSRALGIPVTYDPISVEEFAAGLASRGMSPHKVQRLSSVAIDYQDVVGEGDRANRLPVELVGHGDA